MKNTLATLTMTDATGAVTFTHAVTDRVPAEDPMMRSAFLGLVEAYAADFVVRGVGVWGAVPQEPGVWTRILSLVGC